MKTKAPLPLTLVAFASVYCIWGSTYLAIRFSIETLPPFLMAGVRFLIAGVLLYAWARLRGAAAPTATQWRESAIMGTLLLCGGNGLVCWGQEFIPSGTTALFIALVPILMVLLDRYWRRGTNLNGLTVLGILSGFTGVAILVFRREHDSEALHLGGVIALVGATLCWSFGSIRSRGKDLPSSPTISTAAQMLTGAASLGIVAVCLGEHRQLDIDAVSTRSLLAMSYLVVFGSIIALTAYVWLLDHVSPASASTYAFVNPIIALFLGWLLAGEEIDGKVIQATVLIIGGVVAIHSARHT